MKTNHSSFNTSEPVVSRFANSAWGTLAFLSIFIVVGISVSLCAPDNGDFPRSFPIFFILVPLLLAYLFFKNYATVCIDNDRVTFKKWGKEEHFSLHHIVGHAFTQVQNKSQTIDYLHITLTDGQDFTLCAMHYSNYEILRELLTKDKPLDEALWKRMKKRQLRGELLLLAFLLVVNVFIFIIDPLFNSILLSGGIQFLLFPLIVWIGYTGYKYWEYRSI
jgi:hypothetical protein